MSWRRSFGSSCGGNLLLYWGKYSSLHSVLKPVVLDRTVEKIYPFIEENIPHTVSWNRSFGSNCGGNCFKTWSSMLVSKPHAYFKTSNPYNLACFKIPCFMFVSKPQISRYFKTPCKTLACFKIWIVKFVPRFIHI